jgi:hypothetical protein
MGTGQQAVVVVASVVDDDDDLLFVLVETTKSLLSYTRLGTPSRDRRKARVMMLLSCSLWYHDTSVPW